MYADVEIVLVEDNIEDARLTLRSLRQNNIDRRLLHLSSGEEALNVLFSETFRRQPKLILLDLKMPRISGLEVLEKIKSDPVRKTIPVVMLSSSNEERDVFQSYQLGANAFVVKPVDTRVFTQVVNQMCVFWLSVNTTLA